MKRVNIIELKPNKLQKQILKECMLLSSCVFNNANYICRQNIIKKERCPNFYELREMMQSMADYQKLGRCYNKITEEYTSRTCPICLDDSKSNCKDRIFLCGFCGYVDHRDIIGARNIMLKGMYGLQSIHRQEILPLAIEL